MSLRRTNKSKKVPNVKLRPAEPGAIKAALHAREFQTVGWAQDSEGEDGDMSIVDPCPRPFKGVVLCATGIQDKTTLFKQALELGAMPLQDLTDRVTHLIASECGSAKYKCALERKIPIMKASWVTDCYETWLRGDDVSLTESITRHRLPIFSNVTLSLSGIDDLTRRTKINKLLVQQGGIYLKNLERPVRVTHLLCAGDEQTEKMRYAEKFNRSGEAQIHIVWEEWFWDSLEYGGRFDEDGYKVTAPRPAPKSGLDIVAAGLPQPSSAPITDPSSLAEIPSSAPGQLPDTPLPPAFLPNDGPDEELVSVRRVPKLTLQVWESVLAPRGFVIDGKRLLRSPSKSQSVPASTSPCPAAPRVRPLARAVTIADGEQPKSALARFSRAQSFAPRPADASTPKSAQALFRKGAKPLARADGECSSFMGDMNKDMSGDSPEAGPSRLGGEEGLRDDGRPRPLFTGLKFLVRGEAACASVNGAIQGAGGEVLPDTGDEALMVEADYIIVRLVSGSALYRTESSPAFCAKYRTECWLERCLFAERICEAMEHVAFVPLTANGPVRGAQRVRLSYSGLDESEACWVRRLANGLGLGLAPNFSRRSTHLLCPDGKGAKFDKALEWGVPVVNMSWLEEIVRTTVVPGISAHGLGSPTEPARSPPANAIPAPPPLLKGKGKERERVGSNKIIDITNDAPRRGSTTSPNELSQAFDPPAPIPPALTDGTSDESDDESFGQPGALLGGPAVLPGVSQSTPPPSSSRDASRFPSPDDDDDSLPVASNHPHEPAGEGSESRASEVLRAFMPGHAPPGSGPPASIFRAESAPTPSPAKTVDGDDTRALQEEIANLLGKRAVGTDEAPLRPGKRARPLAKTRSKQDSVFESAPPDATRLSPPSFAPYEGLHTSGGKPLSRGGRDVGSVVYEDPGQRHERAKLLSMFGGEDSGVEDRADVAPAAGAGQKRKPLPRRIVKKPGF